MLYNLWQFIKGVLLGSLCFVAVVIVSSFFGGFNEGSAPIVAFFDVVAFLCGITCASSDGFGILSLILFFLTMGALLLLGIWGLTAVKDNDEAFVGGMKTVLLALAGVLSLSAYILIGNGEGDGALGMTIGTIIVCVIAGLIFSWFFSIAKALAITLSIVICVGCIVAMIVLRINNGSALDY